MKEAKGVAPALGEERPEKNGAAGENDGGGTFGEYGQAKEETEKKEREPRRSRKNRRVFVSREAQYDGGADHTIMPTVVGSKSSSQRAVSAP